MTLIGDITLRDQFIPGSQPKVLNLVSHKSQVITGSAWLEILNLSSVLLRHIGLLEADEDEIRKIRPKGTLFRILYVPREAIRP